MTDYELKVPSPLASRLLTDRNAMAEVLETLLNQTLDAQATEQVGAAPYERSAERGRLSQRLPPSPAVRAGWAGDAACLLMGSCLLMGPDQGHQSYPIDCKLFLLQRQL